jgi:hypothetical protein
MTTTHNTTTNTTTNMTTIKEGECQGKGTVFCRETLPNCVIGIAVVDAVSLPIFTGCHCGQYWGQQQ